MKISIMIQKQIESFLVEMGISDVKAVVERASGEEHGDYVSTIAFLLAKKLGKSPMQAAEEIAGKFRIQNPESRIIKRVEAVAPGFVNFYLSERFLIEVLMSDKSEGIESELRDMRIMVEYAHPNTHKEMHIGHMRTLITGEAISRILESVGVRVFRANYQGDIGPHVAKAIWGIKKLIEREGGSIDEISRLSNIEKAKFLGRGYALGSQEYEDNKEEIDSINSKLYAKDLELSPLYEETRKWSLDYYEYFYRRFYTKFDRLFFESEMVDKGKDIVTENIGKVFRKENEAIVFPGEEYGLHTRVFITKAGNPTYEGKEMANAFAEYKEFPFDLKMHIVGSEQAGYFQVVFKALELLDPEKFEGKQKHISMGMVNLTDRKMSSRTGDILRVDWLLDQVKERVEKLLSEERVAESEKVNIIEEIVVGAVKYSVLKVGTSQNVAFDIEKSVSLEGNSGPYLQYTYARTQSVLRKVKLEGNTWAEALGYEGSLKSEDLMLLRLLVYFDEVVLSAAEKYSPHILCEYLFELAQGFNLFYQKAPILKEKEELKDLRLAITRRVGEVLKAGLDLLGIKAPEKM